MYVGLSPDVQSGRDAEVKVYLSGPGEATVSEVAFRLPGPDGASGLTKAGQRLVFRSGDRSIEVRVDVIANHDESDIECSFANVTIGVS